LNEAGVREGLLFAQARNLPLFVLGGGSNLVVADAGWPGLTLKIAIGGITRRAEEGHTFFEAGAGVPWDEFVAATVADNCSGLECLSGIPGTVGGTPVQNVGAYGQEVSQTIVSVRALDTATGKIDDLAAQQCGFRYRSSIFNTAARGQYIVLRVTFRLRGEGPASLRYGDLQRHFAEWSRTPSLADVRQAVLEIRRAKGMLIEDPAPSDHRGSENRSAGSFFKNPVLTEAQFRALDRRAREKSLELPSYAALDAQWKVSAAWLVEHSGFTKGYRLGNAGISSKHALALVNLGEATAADIVRLQEQIQRRVLEAWGIQLETEPVFVGF
jgi:UDP-N-acetylmuramate dehydrogenase